MTPDDNSTPNFEFERKFLVDALPVDVHNHGSSQVILQSYMFAQGGYAVRVRVSFRDQSIAFEPFDERVDHAGAYERKLLSELMDGDHSSAIGSVAVKSPAVGGERYEMEAELDLDVAVQILYRSTQLVLKNRYSIWVDEDGWEFDVFGGQNAGLIIAEIERISPVVGLKIPDFCVTELTDDPRFTNDSLSRVPWTQWDTVYRRELEFRGPYFLDM